MKKQFRRMASWLCVLALCLGLLPGTALADGDDPGDGGNETEVAFDKGRSISFLASTSDNELFGTLVDYKESGVQNSWTNLFDDTTTIYSQKKVSTDSGEQPYCSYSYEEKDGYHVLTKTYNKAVTDAEVVTEGRMTEESDGSIAVQMPYNGKGTGLAILLGSALRFFAYNTEPDGNGTWYRCGQRIPDDVETLYAQFINPMSLSGYITDPAQDATASIQLNGSDDYSEESPLTVTINDDGTTAPEALYYTANLTISGKMAQLLWSRTDEMNLDIEKTNIELKIQFADGLNLLDDDGELTFQYTGGFVPYVDGKFLEPDRGEENVYTLTIDTDNLVNNTLTLKFGLKYGTETCPTLTLDEFSEMSLTVEGEDGAEAQITQSLIDQVTDDTPVRIVTGGEVSVTATLKEYFTTTQSATLEIPSVYAELRKPATYTVTYEYDDTAPAGAPNLPGQASYTEGAEVTVAAAPTLDGYTFSGWMVRKPASGVTIADGKFNMPAGNVVLTGSWTEIPEPLETITLIPRDMTAYTGGDSISEDEFPSVRYAIGGADPESLTFFVDNTPCEPEPAGTYWLLSGIDNTFTAKARAAAEDDREAGVYDIGVASQSITAQDTDGTEYEVKVADAGELTVRYVSAPEDVIDDVNAVATEIVHDEAAVDTSHGMAVAVIPAGADFYTNGKTSGLGLVGTATEDPQISLLFDDILERDYAGGDSTVDMMVDRAADAGYPLREGRYQFKYLDLVNEHDGNAWVSADEDITIFWPYPDGTNARDYDFYVLHFQGLHREYEIDSLEEMEALIGASDIELIAAEATSEGVRFTLDGDAEAGSFSPFALVWEKAADDRPTRPQRPSRPDPEPEEPEEPAPQEGPAGLNTTDHYAYIAGYEDGTVRPEGNITRAEVATIFFRLMTDEYREAYWATSNRFTDVAPGSWYNNAISTTARAGWIGGYPDGTYRPNNFITRAEFAAIASRFLSDAYNGGDLFTDIGGHWAADHINRASRAGWIGGYPDGSFHPDAYITRAEAVTLINRMLDRAPDAGHLLTDMVRWPDNPETAWYYADIQEATNSHDYIHAGTGSFEVWTELLPNRDWAALEAAWSQAGDAPGGEVADNLTPNVPGDDN